MFLFFATAIYIARITAAGPLEVIEIVILSIGIPSKRFSMSRRVSMATPSQQTELRQIGSSESRPIRVGRSNAVESPVAFSANNILKSPLVSEGVPCPHNKRTVHFFFLYISG